MNDALWWILSTGLIALGIAGTVLPALPGTVFVLGGIVLGAWIDDFTRVGWVTLTVVAVLAVIAWVMDYVSGVLGARKVGIGAALGTVAGIFFGFIGVLFLPLVGAAVGEFIARRHHGQALRVGFATWLGLMVGMVAKVVLAFVMTGIYVVALFF